MIGALRASMPLPANMSTSVGNTAFLTHAPFTSTDMGMRPRSMTGSEYGLQRSRTFAEHRVCFQFSPFLFRRSVTNLAEFPSLGSPSPRAKSAKQGSAEPVVMPRSHVSVARFYDWSEDLGDCFSVSRLYREIANIPRVSTESTPRSNAQMAVSSGMNASPVSNNGSRQFGVNPGRMFIRDKKALTKGEREIIEGIYKNRGDITARDAIVKSEFQVKSHQEAWYAGKSPGDSSVFGKALFKGERIDGKHLKPCGHSDHDRPFTTSFTEGSNLEELSSPKPPSSPDSLNPKSGYKVKASSEHVPSTTCLFCQAQRDAHELTLARRTMKVQSQEGYWDSSPSAPPSTPDNGESRPSTQQQPIFDKLLGLRPSLPPNSILLAEKIRVHNSSNGQAGNGHNNEFKSPGATKPKSNLLVIDKEASNNLRWTSDEISVLTVHSNKSPQQQSDSHRSMNDLRNDQPNVANYEPIMDAYNPFISDDNESDDSERNGKKFKVKVYLPTAEPDHIEDDVSVVSVNGKQLVRNERPLSHNEYKSKSEKSSDDRSDASSHREASPVKLKETRNARTLSVNLS